MSRFGLERAAYHLSLRGGLASRYADDPAGALDELLELSRSETIAALRAVDLRLDLTDDEASVLATADVAELYRRGVHPNVVRNFAGMFGIDYVQRYREAGLRDD
jgi:hypothetical protein